jgi:hypothetical protein
MKVTRYSLFEMPGPNHLLRLILNSRDTISRNDTHRVRLLPPLFLINPFPAPSPHPHKLLKIRIYPDHMRPLISNLWRRPDPNNFVLELLYTLTSTIGKRLPRDMVLRYACWAVGTEVAVYKSGGLWRCGLLYSGVGCEVL